MEKFIQSDNGDVIFGAKNQFISVEDFISKGVKFLTELDGLESDEVYVIEDVECETYVTSIKGIPGECYMKISETDLEIVVMYKGKIGVELSTGGCSKVNKRNDKSVENETCV